MSSPLPPLSGRDGPHHDTAQTIQKEKLKNACRDFEAIFLHTLLREGRGNNSLSISNGENRSLGLMQDMQDEAIGREMAQAGGVGLGQVLYRDLAKNVKESSGNADKIGERRAIP